MPSIRVLLTFFFPRLVGSIREHPTGRVTAQLPAGMRLDQDISGSGGIHHTKSYSIEYNSEPNRNGSKFVQLVDMPGAVSSRSEISVEAGTEAPGGWTV
jgi:hypothetical protein